LTGYGCEGLEEFLAPFITEKAWEYAQKLKEYSNDIAFLVGLPLLSIKMRCIMWWPVFF
jgi:hypothetical protein